MHLTSKQNKNMMIQQAESLDRTKTLSTTAMCQERSRAVFGSTQNNDHDNTILPQVKVTPLHDFCGDDSCTAETIQSIVDEMNISITSSSMEDYFSYAHHHSRNQDAQTTALSSNNSSSPSRGKPKKRSHRRERNRAFTSYDFDILVISQLNMSL